MIDICSMTRGMENLKDYYKCEPHQIVELNFKNYSYIAKVKLSNGDCWEIGYAGQIHKIPEEFMR